MGNWIYANILGAKSNIPSCTDIRSCRNSIFFTKVCDLFMSLPLQYRREELFQNVYKKIIKIQFCTNWKEIVALEHESNVWIPDYFFYSHSPDFFSHLHSRAQVGTQLLTFFYYLRNFWYSRWQNVLAAYFCIEALWTSVTYHELN